MLIVFLSNILFDSTRTKGGFGGFLLGFVS